MTKYEQDTLDKITELNEGILGSIARMFMSSKLKSKYKKAYKIAKDDPELQSALSDLQSHRKRVGDLFKKLCKRNPNHPKC